MSKRTPGVREDRRTGQFVPTIDGKDTSPTSYDESRALEIAKQQCNSITPGEWATSPDAVLPGHVQITVYAETGGRGTRVATVFESEANAAVIAAAPDLLAACEFVLSHLYDPEKPDVQQKLYSDCLAPTDDDKTVRTWLREIIAKAGGRA